MENSELLVVKCPECGLRLSFRPVANYQQKSLTCPRCRHTEAAGKFQPVTASAPKAVPEEAPKTAPAPKAEKRKAVVLRCLDTDEHFELEKGENTVGRLASQPKARVMFSDPDNHMSRHHATIIVDETPSGFDIQIRDERSVNGTYVDDSLLPEKTLVRLPVGTQFSMGDLRFVCNVVER